MYRSSMTLFLIFIALRYWIIQDDAARPRSKVFADTRKHKSVNQLVKWYRYYRKEIARSPEKKLETRILSHELIARTR